MSCPTPRCSCETVAYRFDASPCPRCVRSASPPPRRPRQAIAASYGAHVQLADTARTSSAFSASGSPRAALGDDVEWRRRLTASLRRGDVRQRSRITVSRGRRCARRSPTYAGSSSCGPSSTTATRSPSRSSTTRTRPSAARRDLTRSAASPARNFSFDLAQRRAAWPSRPSSTRSSAATRALRGRRRRRVRLGRRRAPPGAIRRVDHEAGQVAFFEVTATTCRASCASRQRASCVTSPTTAAAPAGSVANTPAASTFTAFTDDAFVQGVSSERGGALDERAGHARANTASSSGDRRRCNDARRDRLQRRARHVRRARRPAATRASSPDPPVEHADRRGPAVRARPRRASPPAVGAQRAGSVPCRQLADGRQVIGARTRARLGERRAVGTSSDGAATLGVDGCRRLPQPDTRSRCRASGRDRATRAEALPAGTFRRMPAASRRFAGHVAAASRRLASRWARYPMAALTFGAEPPMRDRDAARG